MHARCLRVCRAMRPHKCECACWRAREHTVTAAESCCEAVRSSLCEWHAERTVLVRVTTIMRRVYYCNYFVASGWRWAGRDDDREMS